MKKILADPNIPLLDQFDQIGKVTCVPGRQWTNEMVREVDILLVRSVTQINAELLKNSRVSFVGTATSGFDHVDRQYLQQKGIHFSYCPGSNAVSVAEYVLSAILAASDADQKIETMTAGIIGCGHVGSEVEKLFRAVGVTCILNDPPLEMQIRRDQTSNQVPYRSLQEAMSADIVTLHTPLTFDGEYPTYRLISEKELEDLKPKAVFINAARGGIIDEKALIKKIEHFTEMKTIIDCWENEPTIDRELLKKVTIGTPHIAGYSYDGKIKATRMLFDAVSEFYDLDVNWSYEVEQDTNHTSSDQNFGIPEKFALQGNLNDQASLREGVLSHYDIRNDHAGLKAILSLDKNQGSSVFDRLRKDYPTRREFIY